MEFAIIDVLMNIPHGLLFLYYNSQMGEVKKYKTYIFCGIILSAVVTYLNNINAIADGIRIFAVAIIMTVMGMFFTEKKWRILIFSLLNYIMSALFESIAILMSYIFFDAHYTIVMENIFYNILIKIVFFVIYIFGAYLLCRVWNKLLYRKQVEQYRKIELFWPVVAVQILFFVIIVTQFMEASPNVVAGSIVFVMTLCAIVVDLLIFLLIKVSMDKEMEIFRLDNNLVLLEGHKKREYKLNSDIEKATQLKWEILKGIDEAESFLERKSTKKVFKCLDELVKSLSAKDLFCKNRVVDTIIAEKSVECKANEIKLETDLDLENSLNVSNSELCIVVSNLLDNAIRACKNLSDKFISISAREKQGYLVIKQENSFDGIIEERRAEILSEHGLGLGIIESIAIKYDGSLKTEHKKIQDGTDVFSTTVVLKI